jgi:hypothetical protein
VSELDDIRSLLGRYCDLVDTADWDGLGALFEHGRLADEHGHEIASGAEGVAGFFRAGTKLYDGVPFTTHLVANTYLEAPLVARSTFLVTQGLDDFPLQVIITGRYRDTFARDDDGGLVWKERRFAVSQRGDLTRHLTYEL